jgi:hypothetical protein
MKYRFTSIIFCLFSLHTLYCSASPSEFTSQSPTMMPQLPSGISYLGITRLTLTLFAFLSTTVLLFGKYLLKIIRCHFFRNSSQKAPSSRDARKFQLKDSVWHMSIGFYFYLVASLIQISLGMNRTFTDLSIEEVWICGFLDLYSGAVCVYAQLFCFYYSVMLVRMVSAEDDHDNTMSCQCFLKKHPCVSVALLLAALLGAIPLISLSRDGSVVVSDEYGMCTFDAGLSLWWLDSSFIALLLSVVSVALLFRAGCSFRKLVGDKSLLSKHLNIQLVAPVAQTIAYIPFVTIICFDIRKIVTRADRASETSAQVIFRCFSLFFSICLSA